MSIDLKRIPLPSGRAFVLYVAGFCCLAITALMNRHAGISQAATEQGRDLLGWSAILIDVVGLVVFGSVAGNLIAARKKIGYLVLAVTLCSAVYSIGSIMTFVATEWLSVAESRKHQIEAAKAHEEEAKAARESRLKMQQQVAQSALASMQATVKDAGSRKERSVLSKNFAEGATKVIGEVGKETTGTAPPAPVETAAIQLRPDAGAEAVSFITSLPERTYQVTRMALLACLLIVFKLLAFPLGGYYWGRKEHGAYVDLMPIAVDSRAQPDIKPDMPTLAQAPKLQLAAPTPPPQPTKEPTKLLNEPSPEWRLVLDGMDFPRKKGLKEAQRKQHPREQIGWRWLTWLVAHGHCGDYTAAEVERLYDTFCDSDYPRDRWGINVAKGELRTAGKKWITVRDSKSPTTWTIQMPPLARVREQLIKRKVITGNVSPAAEEAAPGPKMVKQEEAGGGARVVPFVEASEASCEGRQPAAANDDTPVRRGPVKGLGELQRMRPDLDGLRRLEREQKRQWQARSWQQHRKQLNRFSRARAA